MTSNSGKQRHEFQRKGPALDLELLSPHGDEGYPGTLHSKVTYTLTPDGELWIEMESTTDTPTLVNLVHHTYWNIAGQATNGIEKPHASGTR